MDNAGIYEYAFHCMLSYISRSKEQFSQAQSTMNDIYRPVLFSADDNTRLYSTVINASERSILLEVCKLVMRLFENNSVGYERFPHDDISDDPLYNLYMPFYRVEEGERVAYLFDDGMGARIDWKGIHISHYPCKQEVKHIFQS